MFAKGQSGNPNGRPKGLTLAALMKKKTKLAEKFIEASEKELPNLLKQLFKKVKEGDMKAITLVLQYTIANPTQIIEEKNETDIKNMNIEQVVAQTREQLDHLLKKSGVKEDREKYEESLREGLKNLKKENEKKESN